MTAETVYALKQDKLKSGENIKTINGKPITGAGNLLVQEEITKAQYDALGDATINDGKLYFVKDWYTEDDRYTNAQIDAKIQAITNSSEEWTFTLEDGTTVTKKVVIVNES